MPIESTDPTTAPIPDAPAPNVLLPVEAKYRYLFVWQFPQPMELGFPLVQEEPTRGLVVITHEENARRKTREEQSEAKASAWRTVAAQLGVTLNLLADEPTLDPDTRAACSRAYAQACAAAGVGEDA